MKYLFAFFVIFSSQFAISQNVSESEINKFLDQWHLAAAKADFKSYFGAMSKDCIYMGTDKSETWTKKDFMAFAKPFFKRKSAWDFNAKSRNIYSKNGIIWFNELLDTWMGMCRGSGVIVKHKNTYKLVQYHLSVTIDNDKIKSFIKLTNEPTKE
ncbi:MAG: nuclear transport factor 2 family protein [Marinifilaceae bacterium]|jgi:murein DD-endopeptidase MepM/ murein hydrolase activator NlpD|nr:nuclear transport factor 2 family protein [Marinifilaceae bacterium]